MSRKADTSRREYHSDGAQIQPNKLGGGREGLIGMLELSFKSWRVNRTN